MSNIFCRPKKDGSVRIILNLKRLNKMVDYHHFKMDTLNHAIALMTKGCYMASIDLKDAYYSIPVAMADRKFLRFWWNDELYQFTCMPNGLSEAPRKYSKIMKVPFSELRGQGHQSSAYLDDSALFGNDKNQCRSNVNATITLLDGLGFTIHPQKSVIEPMQTLVFLDSFWTLLR